MKKLLLLSFCIIIAFFSLRELSSVNEFEAKRIALDILSEKNTNKACGGNFEKYIMLDQENPLEISIMFNFDTS